MQATPPFLTDFVSLVSVIRNHASFLVDVVSLVCLQVSHAHSPISLRVIGGWYERWDLIMVDAELVWAELVRHV